MSLGRHVKKNVDRIDEQRKTKTSSINKPQQQKNLSLGRQRVKKEESVDWIDDAGLSLELADEQYKSVAGSTGKEQKNLSLGRQ